MWLPARGNGKGVAANWQRWMLTTTLVFWFFWLNAAVAAVIHLIKAKPYSVLTLWRNFPNLVWLQKEAKEIVVYYTKSLRNILRKVLKLFLSSSDCLFSFRIFKIAKKSTVEINNALAYIEFAVWSVILWYISTYATLGEKYLKQTCSICFTLKYYSISKFSLPFTEGLLLKKEHA